MCVWGGVLLGNNTSFDDGLYIGAAGIVEIGSDVIGGRDIKFHAQNHNFNDFDRLIRLQGVNSVGIKVGNNCWIGSNVVFLDGADVGNGCVVASGAVVTKKFPDNSVIGGVPAHIIRRRE